MFLCFFFKQKTAYELRISDWSSDVCSSDRPRRERSAPMGARAVRAGALYPAGDVTIIQTMLCEPSQVHSNPGQIATGSPAVFINPNPCPPRSKNWLSHGVPTARVASRKRTLFATGTDRKSTRLHSSH